jgi:hypothetical protein
MYLVGLTQDMRTLGNRFMTAGLQHVAIRHAGPVHKAILEHVVAVQEIGQLTSLVALHAKVVDM